MIPTNRPMVRKDQHDQRLQDRRGEVRRRHRRHPASATSAASRCWWAPPRSRTPRCCPACCDRQGLPHQVLNAKQHAREAEIVAQAGRPGVITIATNMAGRGTDIVLGGNVEKQIAAVEADDSPGRRRQGRQRSTPLRERVEGRRTTQVLAAGGLHIIGTERHESRRIDNQLRGRCRPPGRSGLQPLLPVARRSADAHLRRRARERHHGQPEDARGRGHRAPAW